MCQINLPGVIEYSHVKDESSSEEFEDHVLYCSFEHAYHDRYVKT